MRIKQLNPPMQMQAALIGNMSCFSENASAAEENDEGDHNVCIMQQRMERQETSKMRRQEDSWVSGGDAYQAKHEEEGFQGQSNGLEESIL